MKNRKRRLLAAMLASVLSVSALAASSDSIAVKAETGEELVSETDGLEGMEPRLQMRSPADFSKCTKGYHYDQSSGKWYLYQDGKALTAPGTGWQTVGGHTAYFLDDQEVAPPYEKRDGYYGYGFPNYPAFRFEAGERGIDVSKWQSTIDWKKVAADDISFAFIRSGSGVTTDPKFEENMRGAIENGIDVGVYVYTKAMTADEAREEARITVENLQGYPVNMPIAYDLEDASQQGMTTKQRMDLILAFSEEIKNAGYTPILYTSNSWLKEGKVDLEMLKNNGIDIWVARYGYAYEQKYDPVIWQGTSVGQVDGIAGNVDVDFMLRDFISSVQERSYALEGWSHGKNWYYRDGQGDYLRSQWKKEGNTWYYFDESGKMQTGWLKKDGTYYYLKYWGGMATGWVYDNGIYYYMDKDGSMMTGWQYIGGKWYYLKYWGGMATGWVKVQNTYYYMDRSGAMTTGWQKVGQYWYYMDQSGAMVTGKQKIDGKWYTFNKWGALI